MLQASAFGGRTELWTGGTELWTELWTEVVTTLTELISSSDAR